MKITADREVCIGAGMCVLTAPDVFDQDAEGIVTVLVEDLVADMSRADIDAALRAVPLCPSGALRILDD